MMRGSVAVVGSANMDLVVQCARHPRPGESLMGHSFATHPGGKGANQAVAIGCLGGSAAFVGKIGNDGFGTELKESLVSANVDTTHMSRGEGASGVALIVVDELGQNTIVVAPGNYQPLQPFEVERAFTTIQPVLVLSQLEVPIETVKAASMGSRFVLNPAPAHHLPPDILQRVEVLTPNESELETLTHIRPVDQATCLAASKVLLDQGVHAVVITLGANGSFLATAKGGHHFPPLKVKAVDTTAAGDAFNGALAWFLSEGRDIDNSIHLANCVGALSTTKIGAQASMPNMDELRAVAGSLL